MVHKELTCSKSHSKTKIQIRVTKEEVVKVRTVKEINGMKVKLIKQIHIFHVNAQFASLRSKRVTNLKLNRSKIWTVSKENKSTSIN
jgi:hypothetical protein